jgi:hypothetical protein
MSRMSHSPITRALFASVSSTIAFIAWKVFDTPIQRQLERQVSPEMLREVEIIVNWVIPILIVLPALRLLLKAYAAVRTYDRPPSVSGGAAQIPGPDPLQEGLRARADRQEAAR